MLIKAEFLGHPLAVLHDFETRGELHRWDVTHLFQQRKIAIRFNVASDTRITIPVPGSSDIARFLTKTDVLKTCLS